MQRFNLKPRLAKRRTNLSYLQCCTAKYGFASPDFYQAHFAPNCRSSATVRPTGPGRKAVSSRRYSAVGIDEFERSVGSGDWRQRRRDQNDRQGYANGRTETATLAAVEATRVRMTLRVQSEAGIIGPYSVADAVTDYLEIFTAQPKYFLRRAKAPGSTRTASTRQNRSRLTHGRKATPVACRFGPEGAPPAEQTRERAEVPVSCR